MVYTGAHRRLGREERQTERSPHASKQRVAGGLFGLRACIDESKGWGTLAPASAVAEIGGKGENIGRQGGLAYPTAGYKMCWCSVGEQRDGHNCWYSWILRLTKLLSHNLGTTLKPVRVRLWQLYWRQLKPLGRGRASCQAGDQQRGATYERRRGGLIARPIELRFFFLLLPVPFAKLKPFSPAARGA